jgi:polyferredoxin
MGIDIRDGAQLECINCALCIDACDDVMGRINRPLGLIAFDTEANVERRLKGETPRFHFLRPRTIFYTAVILLVGAIMAFSFSTRHTVAMDVLRDRNPAFVTLSNRSVRNGYTLKLMNRSGAARPLTLDLVGISPARVSIIGVGTKLPVAILVDADRVRTLRVLVTVAPGNFRPGPQPIQFLLASGDEQRTVEAIFVGGNP